jgi:hypothetical protein
VELVVALPSTVLPQSTTAIEEVIQFKILLTAAATAPISEK